MVFAPKTELSPGIFDENKKVKSNIREALLEIAKNVIDELETNINVKDIMLTGSLANYNYNEYSDIDLHIVFDFKDINADKELVKKSLDCNKYVWNLRHNIKLGGHEVELYYQDVDEPHTASGMYSLLKNVWLIEPEKSNPKIDAHTIAKKINNYKKFIKFLEKETSKLVTRTYALKLNKLATSLLEKLKEGRREDLEESGEYSVNNLVFKILRNKKVIDRLKTLIDKTYDKSISESYLMSLKTGPKMRHMHAVGLSGLSRKNPQFVPDMHKRDPSSFSKLEDLKNNNCGKRVLSPSEYNKLRKRYNIDLVLPGKHKMLGNTGIKVYYDNNLKRFIMEK